MDKSAKWSLAAKYGLLLSIVTIVIELITTSFTLPVWASYSFTIIKLALVVYVLYIFMKKYSAMCEGSVSYSQSFGFGFIVSLCSAIVCTLFAFFNYNFINPDIMDKVLEGLTQYEDYFGGYFDMDLFERLMPNLSLVSVFINCLIFGLIIPAILANYTKKEVFE